MLGVGTLTLTFTSVFTVGVEIVGVLMRAVAAPVTLRLVILAPVAVGPAVFPLGPLPCWSLSAPVLTWWRECAPLPPVLDLMVEMVFVIGLALLVIAGTLGEPSFLQVGHGRGGSV